MKDPLMKRVMDIFTLNEKQRVAAEERERDVVVTAGAGSGKTLTLVARYVGLLTEGVSPRRIAAITFTKKAAREMRSRVRTMLNELQQVAESEGERQMWVNLSAQIDSARIGTIHSLCTEILRAHPAEAGVDPRFDVMDEGLSAALRIQAVDDTVNALVEQEEFLPLLQSISPQNLTDMLQYLLERRLEVNETFALAVNNRQRLSTELKERMNHPEFSAMMAELSDLTYQQLVSLGGDKLADMVLNLRQSWANANEALAAGDPIACAGDLFKIRRNYLRKNVGKTGQVKEMIPALQEIYDESLDPFIGGKDSTDPSPSENSEGLFEQILPLLHKAFESAYNAYKSSLETRQALDFDDLEYGAVELLQREEIRARWQNELDAVLVDEFQDTNRRQRAIVNALTGSPGKLFIVGDMRQSIYRFRRADVTVFFDEIRRIKRSDGLVVDLDTTYRAHEPLLLATGDLLADVIGTEEDPERKYYIPFTPLVAHEKNPPENIQPPHIEFVFGAGEDAESARPVAAQALAERLLDLKDKGQIEKWDDVALLFRAATGFPFYEAALEDAGIPFVTVAGRGFYDRPEIRDLVNILRVLSDPMDDLAFAGLLRSPAFGLSDASLFLLRECKQPFWTALQGDLSRLSADDQQCAERAREIITLLLPLVDRVTVAELIKRVVDALDYRAILATADLKSEGQDSSGSGGRLWRNLDKLVEDAQVSQQVSVRNFIEMLKVLNDAGAREGEAPAEALGTVRLMTIHKAKGLEFKFVVLADTSRIAPTKSEQVYLSDHLGVTLKLDPPHLLYNLAKAEDKDQDVCEGLRVLYVAMTRAKSKLIISGHATTDDNSELKFRAWAKDLISVTEGLQENFHIANGMPFFGKTSSGWQVGAWCLLSELVHPSVNDETTKQDRLPESDLIPLYPPIEDVAPAVMEEKETMPSPETWRITNQEEMVPGNILGSMFHKAIEHWLFPPDPQLTSMLDAAALNAGLALEKQRALAVKRAEVLLNRLKDHPIFSEINGAVELYHELPYSRMSGDHAESGYIDLLYRDSQGWRIVDFKTDVIYSDSRREELLQEYIPQMRRYQSAVKALLGVDAHAVLCFLDDQGQVLLVEAG